jgi:phosphoribosylamine--glycine ligase
MNILIVGSGGREHALAWKLAQSPLKPRLLCAPGNALLAADAECVAVAPDDDEGLFALVRDRRIDLVAIGPEAPLCRGLADRLRARGVLVFGPDQAAAELEGSKAFAKALMQANGIPTASYRVFARAGEAEDYLHGEIPFPVVVKASGLAAGKGVVICPGLDEALAAIRRLMVDRAFGASGETVVIEECLVGAEVSVHALTDGHTLVVLPSSQDHKRVFDDDQGPNTGGMGAVSPALDYDDGHARRTETEILVPTLHALSRARRPYRGVLYAGLMLTRSGPKVLEFNVRFGDPEAQVLLPRVAGDLLPLLHKTAEGRLEELVPESLAWAPEPAVTVVLCAGGYPGAFKKGDPILGLEEARRVPGVNLFGAGVERVGGELVTAGGRVLAVTAVGATAEEARERAYEAAGRIRFAGMHYRRDIGRRGRARATTAGGAC